jgi:uncharacterized protein YbaR (Trm112 family)
MIILTCPYCNKEVQVHKSKTEGQCPICQKYFYILEEEREGNIYWLEPIE